MAMALTASTIAVATLAPCSVFAQPTRLTQSDLGDKKESFLDDIALKNDAEDAESYYVRGFKKAAAQDYQGAIDDYNIAIRLNPQHFRAYTNRGIIKRRFKDKQGALADLTTAIKINAEYANAYLNRGVLKLDLGKDSGLKSLSAIDSRYAFGAILLNILQIIFSITEPQTL